MAPRTERLGPYQLLVELASGGMATVWLARATDGRHGPPLVAIKRPHQHLSSDATFLKMIVDEARLASAIFHPNVVKVRELGFEGGMPFIVMDYVEGASLAELRRELNAVGRTVDARTGVRIVLDALRGLHAAHALKDEAGRPLNIVHRDVSPHNILIGCGGRSLIADFGIAHAENRVQTTRTHEIKGKLAYMAPERVDKRRLCTVQSDVFSMAAVLWECLAGRRLFRAEDAVDVLQEVLTLPIPTLRQVGAEVTDDVDDVIARALSRDLDTRYATALELADALEQAAGPDVGTHEDVARLIEAVFGSRMARRQSAIRGAVGGEALAELLQQSGLPTRDVAAEGPGASLLAELAAPVPPASTRYALGGRGGVLASLRLRRGPWWAVAVAASGVIVESLSTLAVRSNRSKPQPIIVSTQGAALAPSVAATRRVVLPLPFPATRVTLDDIVRDLDPATDFVTLEIPGDSGLRHRVTAVSPDGTRADGYVLEDEGVARPDSGGYSYVPSSRGDLADPHRSSSRGPQAGGETRNGFTKLR